MYVLLYPFYISNHRFHFAFPPVLILSLPAASDVAGSSLVVRRQLQDLKDENTTLKSATHRLTQELSQLQAKYRPIDPQVGNSFRHIAR